MRGEEKKGEREEKIKTDVRPVIQSLLPGLTPLDARQSHAAADFWRYTHGWGCGARGFCVNTTGERKLSACGPRIPSSSLLPKATRRCFNLKLIHIFRT